MPNVTAKSLVRTHDIRVEHALYRRTGNWFHILRYFPGALLDEFGYLKFNSQTEYKTFLADEVCIGVKQNTETNTLTIRQGISSHPDYKYFSDKVLYAGEEELGTNVVEGARHKIAVNAYERNASARRRCIERWGLRCVVCDFNFAEKYGAVGEGYIHVHHLIPISSYKVTYTLNPERDLRPVCANCHAMLHQEEPPLAIEELQACLRRV